MAGDTPALPPPRRERGRAGPAYRIALVCLGNICRSPMAEVVLGTALRRTGLDGTVEVVSAGTGGWHVGNPMDRRAAAVLTAHGYDASLHRAQQFDTSWFDDTDLVLVMDRDNHAEVTALADDTETRDRVRLYREHDPLATSGGAEVPDPYYGGDDGFDHVLAMVRRTADALAEALADTLAGEEWHDERRTAEG